MMLLLVLALAPQDTADPYTKFKPGTTWVYDFTRQGKTELMTHRVVKVDERLWIESTQSGKSRTESLFWQVSDGCLLLGERKGEKDRDVFHVWKIGSKKGEKWRTQADGEDAEVEHLGTEEVETPAGKFANTIHVRMVQPKKGGSFSLDFYLAPNVGLVKILVAVAVEDAREESSLVLREFKETK